MANLEVQESLSENRILGVAADETWRPRTSRSPWMEVLQRLIRNKLALAGMIMIGLILIAALFAPLLAREDPDEYGIFKAFPRENKQAPSLEHPMGTDALGRDLLSLIIYGSRISIRVGVFAVGLAILVGATLGAIAGYSGGVLDNLIMRVMDVMLAFPTILLALAIVVVIGPGLFNAMVAVGIVSIPTFARITRATVLGEV
ncbi:MAG: ABC transporter permease, partial [Anaerolineae bacterium]